MVIDVEKRRQPAVTPAARKVPEAGRVYAGIRTWPSISARAVR